MTNQPPGPGAGGPTTTSGPTTASGSTSQGAASTSQGAASTSQGAASTTDAAKESASQVKDTATAEAQHVAGTAGEEARKVVEEVQHQARDLLGELRTQVGDQTRTQKDRIAQALAEFTDELDAMIEAGGRSGIASELARQVSSRAGDLRSALEGREPGDVLDDVRRLARRRPGTFLLGAVTAGVLAGRLTRGGVQAHRDEDGTGTTAGADGTLPVPRPDTAPATTGVPPVGAPPPGAGTGAGAGAGAAGAYERVDPTTGNPVAQDPVEPGLSSPGRPGSTPRPGGLTP
ncbi:hypothetical protein [Thalassiella azotivora]